MTEWLFPESPAEKAGLLTEDRLIAVGRKEMKKEIVVTVPSSEDWTFHFQFDLIPILVLTSFITSVAIDWQRTAPDLRISMICWGL